MQESIAVIESIRRVNDTHQHLDVTVDESLTGLRPGQYVMVKTNDTFSPYLREAWHPVDARPGRLIFERPIEEQYDVGHTLNLIGICGENFRFRPTVRNVLMIALDTPPTPLLMATQWVLRNKIAATLVLLGSAAEYGTAHLPPQVEVIHGTNDVRWPGQVMTVGWADQVFVCVPPYAEQAMLRMTLDRFKELRAEVAKNYLFGVHTGRIACGLGMCWSCAVEFKSDKGGDLRLACTKGPAFDLSLVIL